MMREEVEVCPFCCGENIFRWNVEKNGYKVKCQHCGEEIMLCDACLHSDDNKGQFCDWSELNGCWRSRIVDITVYKDTVDSVYKGDNNLIIIKLPEWCMRNYVSEISNINYHEWINSYTADDTERLFDFITRNEYKYEIKEY